MLGNVKFVSARRDVLVGSGLCRSVARLKLNTGLTNFCNLSRNVFWIVSCGVLLSIFYYARYSSTILSI